MFNFLIRHTMEKTIRVCIYTYLSIHLFLCLCLYLSFFDFSVFSYNGYKIVTNGDLLLI